MDIQWPLVFFTLFIGLGCGTFAGSIIITEWFGRAKQIRMLSSIIAIVALGLGGMASTLHLGHPERMFGALGHPTSGIFMESSIIFLLGLDILIYLLALRRNVSGQTCKIIGTVGIVLAIALAFVNGDTYVMAARPAWNTLVLPVLYIASAAVMGCFSLNLLLLRTEHYDKTAITATETAATTEATATTLMINRASLAALAIQAVLMIAYLVHIAVAPYPDMTRSVARVLLGNLALLFWGGWVLLGLVVPAALMTKFYAKKAKNIAPLTSVKLGLACVLVAGIAFRMLMFSLGSSIRQFF